MTTTHELTDKELTWALAQAEADEETEDITLILNTICERLDIPLDQTEQGLTPEAAARIDAYVAEHFTS